MNYGYIQELQNNIIQAEQDMADAINDLDTASFAS
jgi:DNA polymerase III delta prime subunit